MGKLTGVIQFQGRVGNLTADKNGNVRIRVASRTTTAARTLENNAEFGNIATATKIFVDGTRAITGGVSRVTRSRLTTLFSQIKLADTTSVRGKRGVLDAECEALTGIDLNDLTSFDGVFSPFPIAVLDRVGGANKISVPAYNANTDLSVPTGTTHYQFKALAVAMSFEGDGVLAHSDAKGAMTALNGTAVPTFDLPMALPANQTGVICLLIGIDFFQEVNGQKYELQNGLYNPTKVLMVSGS